MILYVFLERHLYSVAWSNLRMRELLLFSSLSLISRILLHHNLVKRLCL